LEGDQLYFDSRREDRGWYFVDYHPPECGEKLAVLNIVAFEPRSPSVIADAMQAEIDIWLERYPVPVQVFGFDDKGDLADLDGIRPCGYLIGWRESDATQCTAVWAEVPQADIPGDSLTNQRLLDLFADIPHRTSSEVERDFKSWARRVRVGWFLVFFWTGLAPILWLVATRVSPPWVGLVLFIYALAKALIHVLKLLGKWPESQREREAADKTNSMEHYFYHCERNPEGFARLKAENFARDAREEIRADAAALKASAKH